MGGGLSNPAKIHNSLLRSEQEIVRLMLPVYYAPPSDVLTPSERLLASKSWDLILNDLSPAFLNYKMDPTFPYVTCVTFFYDTFYRRLFDIHPMSKSLFKNGMKSQGKFLVKMISLALSELDDPEKFDKTLVKLAEIHYQRGVKGVEYGIVGEVLFYTIRTVIGDETYTRDVHVAWVKIYSRMLRTIVPVAISLEMRDGSCPQNRLNEQNFKTFSTQVVSSAPSTTRDSYSVSCKDNVTKLSPTDEESSPSAAEEPAKMITSCEDDILTTNKAPLFWLKDRQPSMVSRN